MLRLVSASLPCSVLTRPRRSTTRLSSRPARLLSPIPRVTRLPSRSPVLMSRLASPVRSAMLTAGIFRLFVGRVRV